MNISTLKAKEAPVRTFHFPPAEAPDSEKAIRIDIQHIPASRLNEIRQRTRIKFAQEGTPDLEQDAVMDQAIIKDFVMKAVKKIDGMNIDKLCSFFLMDQESINTAGGLETPVNLNPSGSLGDEARKNLQALFEASSSLCGWIINVAADVSKFQDKDWKEQVRNLQSGQSLKTAE